MTPEELLTELVERVGPELATVEMLKFIFKGCAEMQAAIETHTKVLGAIAGRVGITGDKLRQLLDEEPKP